MNAQTPLFKSPEPQKPCDLEVEGALIGTLMAWNEDFAKVATYLEPRHFAEQLHQRLFDAIAKLIRANVPANIFTLNHAFRDDRQLESAGGRKYLIDILALGQIARSAEQWGRMVHDMACQRLLAEVAREIEATALDPPVDWSAARTVEYAEGQIADIGNQIGREKHQTFRLIGEIAGGVVQAVTGPRAEPTVTFGLGALDVRTGGLRRGEYVIIGARPGMGKTAIAGHIGLSAARLGTGVAFFSMEMTAASIGLRLVTATAFAQGRFVAYEAARKGTLTPDECEALIIAEAELNTLPLMIHEGRGFTASGIMLAAKRLKAEHDIGLVIVDHLQKIKPERDMRGNKVGEMTEISDTLQKMAGILDLPVIALSQLNRASEKRDDKKPELGDLRESGAIEQDADLVLMLYRKAYYLKKKEPSPPGTLEHNQWHADWSECRHDLDVHIAKHRNGSEGMARVYFDAPSSGLRDA